MYQEFAVPDSFQFSNFPAQEVWAEKANNDLHNIFLWSASLEILLQCATKDILRSVWISGCLWQLHCGTQVFISFSSLGTM